MIQHTAKTWERWGPRINLEAFVSANGVLPFSLAVQPYSCSGLEVGASGCGSNRGSFTGMHLKPSVARSVIPWALTLHGTKRNVIMKAAIQEKEQEKENSPKPDAEETTRKLGLEAGLWQIFTSKDVNNEGSQVDKTTQAKDLLTRYGGAYLATSISLSLVSFGLCYVLVNNGVDLTALLENVGIHANETGGRMGTIALAYAAHKAIGLVRFPPRVFLTPIVANWFSKVARELFMSDRED